MKTLHKSFKSIVLSVMLLNRVTKRAIPAIIFLGVINLSSLAQTGPNSPVAEADGGAGAGGTPSWTNLGNAGGQNDTYTTLVDMKKNKDSPFLHLTDFRFGIPDGDQINGILVEIDRYATHPSANTPDLTVQIIVGGTRIGNNNSVGANWSAADGDVYETFGGSGDNWDLLTLTGADVNAADFGVAFQVHPPNTGPDDYDLFVDHVRITVWHSAPDPSFTATINGNWNLGATWGNPGNDVEGDGFPGIADDAKIPAGITVTVPAGFPAKCNDLTINSDESNTAALLNLTDGSSSLQVDGDLRVEAEIPASNSITHELDMNGGTLSIAGTMYLEADKNGGNKNSTKVTVAGGTITVNGDINLLSDDGAADAELDLLAAGSTLNLGGDIVEAGTPVKGQLLNINGNSTVNFTKSGPQTIETKVGNTTISNYGSIICSGSGAKTLEGNITIDNLISMQGTATLSNGGNALSYGVGIEIEYNGSSVQTTGDELKASGTINTLTINNANGVNINVTGVKVTTSVNLTAGKLDLGANTLIVDNAGTIAGGGTTNYIVADDAAGGILQKNWNANGSFTYQVGDQSNYSPYYINFNSATYAGGANLQVSVEDSKEGSNSSVTNFINRYWVMAETGISSANYDFSGEYVDGDINGIEAGITAAKYNAVDGWVLGKLAETDGPNTLSANNMTTFSTITGGEMSALPVELVDFSAIAEEKDVNTSWMTASESNNNFFTVEKTLTGDEFDEAGFVLGSGNSNSPRYYGLEDHNPYPGVSFYRLKQTDYDGKTSVSDLVAVEVSNGKGIDFIIYPNPSNKGFFCFEIRGVPGDSEISIIFSDLYGREVLDHSIRYNGTYETVNHGLKPGIYLVKLVYNNMDFPTVKMIVNER